MKKLLLVMVVLIGLSACEMIDEAQKEIELWTADVECMEDYEFDNDIIIENEQDALMYMFRIRYEYDEDVWGKEYFQTPEETVYFKTGDCEDYALLLAYLLDRIGIKVYLVCINDNSDSDHIILYYNGKYVEPQTGWEYEFSPNEKIEYKLPYCKAIYMAVTYHDFIGWYRI
jgi:hypothetical protein